MAIMIIAIKGMANVMVRIVMMAIIMSEMVIVRVMVITEPEVLIQVGW
jgi:hypothetical protein